MRNYPVIALFVCLLTLGTSANTWTKLAEGDGYKSGNGVIVAKQTPQSPTKVASVALSFLDIPYTWAGTDPETGFDCSGYVYEVMRLNGYEVPRMADHQFEQSARVSRDNLKVGDMVFFTTYLPGPSHVGIYLGDGEFVHASSAGEGVVISQLNSGYYQERFLGGGRPDGWIQGSQSQEQASRVEPTIESTSEAVDSEPDVLTHDASVTDVVVEEPVEETSEPETPSVASRPRLADPFNPERMNRAPNEVVSAETADSEEEEQAAKLQLVSGEMLAVAKLEMLDLMELLKGSALAFKESLLPEIF